MKEGNCTLFDSSVATLRKSKDLTVVTHNSSGSIHPGLVGTTAYEEIVRVAVPWNDDYSSNGVENYNAAIEQVLSKLDWPIGKPVRQWHCAIFGSGIDRQLQPAKWVIDVPVGERASFVEFKLSEPTLPIQGFVTKQPVWKKEEKIVAKLHIWVYPTEKMAQAGIGIDRVHFQDKEKLVSIGRSSPSV